MAKEKREVTPQKQELQRMPQRFVSPLEEMERMFEGFFPSGWMRPFRGPVLGEFGMEAKALPVDIIDRDEEIVLRAEIPGVKKEDIDISMSDNLVTIKGSSSYEEKEEHENYYRSEIARGTFSRTVALPSDVDGDKSKAVFKDGVLELTMPKLEKSKRHSIKVE